MQLQKTASVEKTAKFPLIRLGNTFFLALLIFCLDPLYLAKYTASLLLLLPPALYLSLETLSKTLVRVPAFYRQLYAHLELLLMCLLVAALLYLHGGLASYGTLLLFVPLLCYIWQFGRAWSYGALALNTGVLIAALSFGVGKTAFKPGAALFFLVAFPLACFLACRTDLPEKLKRWSGYLPGLAPRRGSRDELTGLHNKYFFQKKLKGLLQKERQDLKTALILLRLHCLELLRENWGRCAENILLKGMAEMLSGLLEKNELAAHLGEGTFAVLTQGKDLAAAVGRGEQLRRSLRRHLDQGLEDEWKVPLGVGLALSPDHATSVAGLLRKAETALARALSARGGRVQVYYSPCDRLTGPSPKKHFLRALKRLMAPLQSLDRAGYEHSERVFIYTQLICRGLRLGKRKSQIVEIAAFLHDLGKIELQGLALLRHGLDQEPELEIYKQHPLRGAEILRRQLRNKHTIIAAVLHHHEKYDGSGYPLGLQGDAIPLGARIIAVADFFDRLTAEKHQGQGLTLAQGIRALWPHRGSSFDPLVVEALVRGLAGNEDLAQVMEWPKDLSKVVPCGYTAHHYLKGGHYAEFYYGEVHFMVKAVYCLAAALINRELCLYVMDEEREQVFLRNLLKFSFKGELIAAGIRSRQLERVSLPQSFEQREPPLTKFELEVRRLIKGWLERCEAEEFRSVRLIIDHASLGISFARLLLWEEIWTRCIKGQEMVVACYHNLESAKIDPLTIAALHHTPLVLETDLPEGEGEKR